MKYLALAMLLAVIQTPAPVPQKAANPQTQNVTGETKGDQTPAQPIRESAPVPKGKDWWDKIYVLATVGVFLVGAAGVVCAVVTLWAIRGQGTVMAEQRQVMLGQLRTMQEQITEMCVQSGILQESVSVARDAAKAAQDGANAAKESADATRDSVDTFISKERARLRIAPLAFKPDFSTKATFVDYSISFYGNAHAFISQSAAYAVITNFKSPGIDDVRAEIFKIGLPDVVSSAADLSPRYMVYAYRDNMNQISLEAAATAINEARAFVHFYAFIKYRTLDTDRETRVCLTWEVNPAVNALIGKPVDHWEKSGAPEANRET
jgi:hypothetical protein